jgi:hypothetical protein
VHLVGFYYTNTNVCTYVCNVGFLYVVPFHKHVKILNLKFRKLGGTSTMLKLKGHSTLKSTPAHTTNIPWARYIHFTKTCGQFQPAGLQCTKPQAIYEGDTMIWFMPHKCTVFNWTYKQLSLVLAYMQLVLPSLSYVVPNALLLFPPW